MELIDWLGMFLQTNLYLSCWLMIRLYVSRHGPHSQARRLNKVNNWFYSAASLILFCIIITTSQEQLARKLYHYSKFYEYIDVFGVQAGGGFIDLHFGFHHLTTPYLTFVRVLNHGDGWKFFAALNSFHHFLMYAFFGGFSRLRSVLLVTGFLQLVIGIAQEWRVIHWKAGRGEEIWPNVVSSCLLGTYLVLWVRDLALRHREPEAAKADSE
ncbi:hypothetical protein HJFPF1_05303 [Paramyrothecium foliicola]|nr:hypothetical protein HJFPF1_05303 [Paramyrothecium foliicola]